MRIVIGSDHAGFHYKNHLRDWLRASGHDVTDLGVDSEASADYPNYARLVGEAVARGDAERGVLVCGTGVGMSIAANKVRGVRAVACSEAVSATLSRAHNDANVVCLGQRIVGLSVAESIVGLFVGTPFSNEDRHNRRVKQICGIEESPRSGR